jgi:hypothetical protein
MYGKERSLIFRQTPLGHFLSVQLALDLNGLLLVGGTGFEPVTPAVCRDRLQPRRYSSTATLNSC